MRPLLFGVFARALPLTMFGPLLPGIASSLGATLAGVGWIVATYATGSLLAQPLMGTLSDAYGRRRVFLWCMALFVLGSCVCAAATSLPLLITGRVIQAFGAGGIQPVAAAIIGDALPAERRGAALGLLYAVFGIGTMAGALIGGAIVAAALAAAGHTTGAFAADLRMYPWHPVFVVNIATGVATMLFARNLPLESRAPNPALARSFDVAGALLIATFAASLMIAVTRERWESSTAGLVAFASLCIFVWHVRRAKTPLIDPGLFAARGPAMLYGIAVLFGIPSFSLTIYSATYYIAQFHASAAQAGSVLFVLAALYVAGAIAGGALINRFGSRALLAAGAVFVTIAASMLAGLTSTYDVVAAMALGGLGLGFASAPPNALILRYAPSSRAGTATGVATMLATSGSITAPAVIGAFLAFARSTDPATALRAEFALCAVLAGACAVAACALPKPVAVAS
ncbi:MAG TPA: MFS transporter [Candidatus Eremiobacteraceae bacterium]